MTTTLYTRSFLLLALAHLFTAASFGSFFLFPLFLKGRGASEGDIGVLMGVFTLSSLLARPLVAEMIDRIGRKRSYTLGCAIMGVFPFLYLLFSGELSRFYYPLLAVRFLHGIGLAICFTAPFTYISDIVPQNRLNEGVAMFGIFALTGIAGGPLAAEAVIHQFGFSFFFLCAGTLGLLGFMIHIPILDPFPRSTRSVSPSFRAVFCQPKILAVFLLAVLFGFGLAGARNFLAPFARDRQIGMVSVYYLAYSFGAIAIRPFGGRLADRVGEERLIPYGLVVTGAGLLVLVLLQGNLLLLISGLLSGCGQGLLFPCLNALAIRDEPLYIRGKITGIFTGGIDGGGFAGAFALGYLGQWLGFPALFLTAGLAPFLGLLVFHGYRRKAALARSVRV